jgi:hypothetical protein
VATVSSGLASKPAAAVFSGLASKPAVGFLVEPQNQGGRGFSVWTSKPAALIWSFGPQNHRDGILIWASKPSRLRFVGCVTKPMEGGRRGSHVEI